MCRTDKEVDALMTKALVAGATLLKHAQKTSFGGYSGYFADPDGHAWEAVRAPGFEFTPDNRVILPIEWERTCLYKGAAAFNDAARRRGESWISRTPLLL